MSSMHTIENAIGPDRTSFDLLKDKFTNKALGIEMSYAPHMYHQGYIGSCVSNAVASAYRYALQRQGQVNNQPIDFLPSRLFLYYVARIPTANVEVNGSNTRGNYYADLVKTPPTTGILNNDTGCQIREVIRILDRLGAPPESQHIVRWDQDTWPYTYIPGITDSTEYDALSQDDKDLVDKLAVVAVKSHLEDTALAAQRPHDKAFLACKQYTDLHYARPMEKDYHCWKQCIANGYPIVFAIDDYPTFQDSITTNTHVAATPTPGSSPGPDEAVSGHAMLAVGWNDTMDDDNGGHGCFKVQNSWGDKIGDKLSGGFCWIPYAWLTTPSPWHPGFMMTNSPWVLVDQKAQTVSPKVDAP